LHKSGSVHAHALGCAGRHVHGELHLHHRRRLRACPWQSAEPGVRLLPGSCSVAPLSATQPRSCRVSSACRQCRGQTAGGRSAEAETALPGDAVEGSQHSRSPAKPRTAFLSSQALSLTRSHRKSAPWSLRARQSSCRLCAPRGASRRPPDVPPRSGTRRGRSGSGPSPARTTAVRTASSWFTT